MNQRFKFTTPPKPEYIDFYLLKELILKIPMEQSITIILSDNNQQYPLQIKPSQTINQIINIIEAILYLDMNNRILQYKGIELKMNKPAYSYNIINGSKIYIKNYVEQQQQQQQTLNQIHFELMDTQIIDTMSNKIIKFKIEFQNTYYEVEFENNSLVKLMKMNLVEIINIPVEQQQIYNEGILLDDEMLLGCYNIMENSILQVKELKKPDQVGILIIIQNQLNKFYVSQNATIKQLKQEIQQKFNFPLYQQNLILNSTTLQDRQIISKLWKSNNQLQLEIIKNPCILINLLNGEQFKVFISCNETLRTLKNQISQKINQDPLFLMIEYNKIYLVNDNLPLEYWQIQCQGEECYVQSTKFKVILIQIQNESNFQIQVQGNEEIQHIKEYIEIRKGIPACEWEIYYNQLLVDDSLKIKEINIKEYETLICLRQFQLVHKHPYQPKLLVKLGNKEIQLIHKYESIVIKLLLITNVKQLKKIFCKIKQLNFEDFEFFQSGAFLMDLEQIIKVSNTDQTTRTFLVISCDQGLQILLYQNQLHKTEYKSNQEIYKILTTTFKIRQEDFEGYKTTVSQKIEQLKLIDNNQENLFIIFFWTLNVINAQINQKLDQKTSFNQLGEIKFILKKLQLAFASLTSYNGVAYAGFKNYRGSQSYQKDQFVVWRRFTQLNTDVETAKKIAQEDGTMFEIQCCQAKLINQVSFPSEQKEIIMLPFTLLKVVSSIEEEGIQHIKLKEYFTPSMNKFVFWVDNQKSQILIEKIKKIGVQVLECQSNLNVIETLQLYYCILQNECNFRIFSVMERFENGVLNDQAGLDLIELLNLNFPEFPFEILLFSKNIQKAKISLQQRSLQIQYRIVSDEEEVITFCTYGDNLSQLEGTDLLNTLYMDKFL